MTAFALFHDCRMFAFLSSKFSCGRLLAASLKLISLYQQEWQKWPGAFFPLRTTAACVTGFTAWVTACSDYDKPNGLPQRSARR